MPAKYRKTVSKTLGSSSKDVFERRMSTESGPLTFLVSDFAQTFGQIVSTRIKRLTNKNLLASRHTQGEKVSLSVDVQRPKRLCLSPLLTVSRNQVTIICFKVCSN